MFKIHSRSVLRALRPVGLVLASGFLAHVAFAASLRAGFESPPEAARPRVWWHWMNGDVTQAGIRKDLQWMHRIGVGGVDVIDASLGTPQVVRRPLAYMTPPWNSAFRLAARLATRYGLELSIDSSPGWSETGGPWVTPGQAMKKLVWSATVVRGGRPFHAVLAQPPANTGAFQDAPMSVGFLGPDPFSTLRFYRDSLVIAYRAAVLDPHPTLASSSEGPLGPRALAELSDGKLTDGVSLAPRAGRAWIQLRYARPVRLQGVTLAAAAAGMPAMVAQIDVSADGVRWKRVARFAPAAEQLGGYFPQQTVAFAPVTAQYVRLVMHSAPAPGLFGAPFVYNAPGAVPMSVRMRPFAPRKPLPPLFDVHELVPHSAATINQFEAKADFRIVPHYRALISRAPLAAGTAVNPADVVNLTQRMSRSGVLQWSPPPGTWVVLRLGYSLEGTTNHPAPRAATGLEVDKLSRADVRSYMNHYLGLFRSITGPFGRDSLTAFTTDSTEVGMQNWTPHLIADFERLRGYDPIPWLPALTGVVVGDRAESNRFLWDFRHTIKELLARNHYAQIQRMAHAAGLVTYGEALEDHRPTFGDDMQMRRYADVPMGAMWMYPPGKRPDPTYVADLKGAASVADVYGKSQVGAESLDSVDQPWAFAPRQLKRVVDREFLLGVNRIVIHESTEQPLDRPPGLSLAFFGQMFNRLETWAPEAGPWIRYLSRCSYLLQQGHYAADVAYFYGQTAPITGIFGNRRIDVPRGYGFDFVDENALLNQLSVRDGQLVSRSGMRYRLLYLGGTSRWMTLRVLRRIDTLVREGATVVGRRPEGTPSLRDDALQFRTLAQRLFGPPGTATVRVLGRGRIFTSGSLRDALRALGLQPEFDDSSARGDTRVRATGRVLDRGELFFVSNRQNRRVRLTGSFRVTGYAPELWNPVTGAVQPVSYRIANGRTRVPLRLGPYGSTFVVFRKPAKTASVRLPGASVRRLMTLHGPWRLAFQAGRGAPATIVMPHLASWSVSRLTGVKYFSGTATYTRTWRLPEQPPGARVVLDLGQVRELAQVRVNGREAGIVWTPPFRLDITRYVHPGQNTLSIAVTNLWVNRLIGDQQPDVARKYTFTTIPTYEPDAPLRSSGLLGPVRLERVSARVRR